MPPGLRFKPVSPVVRLHKPAVRLTPPPSEEGRPLPPNVSSDSLRPHWCRGGRS